MNKNKSEPFIIKFPKIGSKEIGYISVAENSEFIPFDIKRVFWTYYTPENIVRGNHAHFNTEQILIAVSGKIIVNTEDVNGKTATFILDNPQYGLYIPPDIWHTMKYSNNAIQMVIASQHYNEEDYIRDYHNFKNKR